MSEDDQNINVEQVTNDNDWIKTTINMKYALPVTKHSDDADILADSLLLSMQDLRSGFTPLALMHLDRADIEMVLQDLQLTRHTMSDLSKFVRRSCRQLVSCTKEKLQQDKDAYKLEHILRRTVGDLESRKEALEKLVVDEERDLQQLKVESERLREENEAMAMKMDLARDHLINAGVFDPCFSPNKHEIPQFKRELSIGSSCSDRRFLSERGAARATLKVNGPSIEKPKWRH